MTEVSAVICAYGFQPYLVDAVSAVLASRGVSVEVIVVDNGSPDCAQLPGEVTVLRPGGNVGFAQGCNLGVQAARGSTIAFVNSDAIVDPDCLARLHEVVQQPGTGLVGATILLAQDPNEINSWGNPVHLLGFSWAGGYGHPVSDTRPAQPASVAGAVFAVDKRVYNELLGLDGRFFAYGEDMDLSLRTWLSGRTVQMLPAATAAHYYDFGRNADKMYLVERNRLITILTLYRMRTLLGLAPLIAASEVALLARSAREGWLAAKVRGWGWLVTNRRYLRARRNRLQGSRVIDDKALTAHMAVDLDPPARFGISVSPNVRRAVIAYWTRIGSRVAGV